MSTNTDAFLVNTTLVESDAEFLSALGFSTVERVKSWKEADFGFIRYKDSFLLFPYGKYASEVSDAIENGGGSLCNVLGQVFGEAEVLAVVLQGSTGLACFGLFESGNLLRRWGSADGHGTLFEEGEALEAERAATADGLTGEEIVHAVATHSLGFDLLEVFEARDTGQCDEVLFRVAVAA